MGMRISPRVFRWASVPFSFVDQQPEVELWLAFSAESLEYFSTVSRWSERFWTKTENVISCSTRSAGEALGDVSCQWHFETHALKRFQHEDNPQNQSKEANEV